MDFFQDYKICYIEDCSNNKDCQCMLNLYHGSNDCETNKRIKASNVQKGERKRFDSEMFMRLSTQSTSKGSQDKWVSKDKKYFVKERFFYQERFWNDDLVEIIASAIGEQLGFHVLKQELCEIEGRDACFSEFFNEKFIPFAKFDKTQEIFEYNNPLDRLEFVLKRLKSETGLELHEYLYQMSILDFLVGNEDRHVNNFGVFWDGEFKPVILFDFGLGLFEHDIIYDGMTLEQARTKMTRLPFGDQREIIKYLGNNKLNKCIILKDKILSNSLAKDYLQWACNALGLEVIF